MQNAGDVTPFHRPSEKDFRDVTAFIMCTLLHEKIPMPRLCQKMTLSDVLNPRITSTWAREIGGPEEVISVGKEFHDFILKYNVAMRGPMEGDDKPCTSNFFLNTKGKSFDYGIGKDISRFKEKYDIIIGLKQYEVNVQMEGAPSNTSAARQKKEQFMLVYNFVFNSLTVKYPFINETPTLKDIENEILRVTTECDLVANKEYCLWPNLADHTIISKSISDRWIYCNQEEIARRAVAMYREPPRMRIKRP